MPPAERQVPNTKANEGPFTFKTHTGCQGNHLLYLVPPHEEDFFPGPKAKDQSTVGYRVKDPESNSLFTSVILDVVMES